MSGPRHRYEWELELLKAYDARDLARVREALAAGAGPDTLTADGEAVLALAVEEGALEMVRALLAGGANPNAAGIDFCPALSTAVMTGREDIARALIEAGADVEAVDEMGESALILAAQGRGLRGGRSGDWAIGLLLAAGARVEAKDEVGRTALACAAERGRLDEMRALIAGGADTMRGDESWRAPWGAAERAGKEEALGLLRALWEAEDVAGALGEAALPRGGSQRM